MRDTLYELAKNQEDQKRLGDYLIGRIHSTLYGLLASLLDPNSLRWPSQVYLNMWPHSSLLKRIPLLEIESTLSSFMIRSAWPVLFFFVTKAMAAPNLSCGSAFSESASELHGEEYKGHAEEQARQLVQLLIDTQSAALTSSERQSRLSGANHLLKTLTASNPEIVALVMQEWRDRQARADSAIEARRKILIPKIRTLEEELRRLSNQWKSLPDWIPLKDSDENASVKSELLDLLQSRRDTPGAAKVLEVEGERYILTHQISSQVELDSGRKGGHKDTTLGARVFADGRILSWSSDHTLILWRSKNGRFVVEQRLGQIENSDPQKGHTEWVQGGDLLPDGRILSWSGDSTLILWKVQNGMFVFEQRLGEKDNSNHLVGHTDMVDGAQMLPDGRILSWSGDFTLLIWKSENGQFVVDQRLGEPETKDPNVGHVQDIVGAQFLPDGRILSWSNDNTLIVWKAERGKYTIDQRLGEPLHLDSMKPQDRRISGITSVQVTPDGSLLSSSLDYTLTVWKAINGRFFFLRRLGEIANRDPKIGHTNSVIEAHQVNPESIVSLDLNGRIIFWGLPLTDTMKLKIDRLSQQLESMHAELAGLRAKSSEHRKGITVGGP